MRKKSLLFLALAAISLSACSYNPFNEFTGINFNFSISNSLEVNQILDKIVWERNEECTSYDVYVHPDESSTSSSSKKSEPTVLQTFNRCGFTYDTSLLGKRIQIVGCKYDEKDGKKAVCKSKIITLPTKAPTFTASSSETLSLNYNNVSNYSRSGVVTIPASVTHLELGHFAGSGTILLAFKFDERPSGDVVRISLNNTEFKSSSSTLPAIDYGGTNKDVTFVFRFEGSNYITGGDSTSYTYSATNAINLPNVCFYDGNGSLTITGGSSSSFSSKYEDAVAGYAISANKIINCATSDSAYIKAIGGNGGEGIKYTRGGHGQLPFNKNVKVLTTYSSSIGIKGGNGGKGGLNAYGGDAYAFSYLTDVAYKKYKPSFYKLDEPTPGEGGTGGGKGKLITK